MQPSLTKFKIPSVSVVQFTVQMSKLNRLGKTCWENIFVVELKLKIAYTNSFWNQYFSVNQSDLRERKERINKLFIGLR